MHKEASIISYFENGFFKDRKKFLKTEAPFEREPNTCHIIAKI